MKTPWIIALLGALLTPGLNAAEALDAEAAAAMRRATEFFTKQVAVEGGYVYRYSADLMKREGEGKAEPQVVWVQPPGTPLVGLAFVEAYERTGEAYLLDAAKAAADCLIRGQLRSGGWNASIDFSAAGRKKNAYRVDPPRKKVGFNVTTFDDDKTQSALRFLTRLDRALQFKDERIHDATKVALDSVVQAQFPNGAWGQGYDEFPDPAKHPVTPAKYPAEWPRKYPGIDYWFFYTFNDNSMADTIEAMLQAGRIYGDERYRGAALRAGEFMILSQMPDPQPAWAQQYNFDMEPCWARKFEPASITGHESQGVMRSLMRLYVESGDRKFLAPIPKALAYLKASRLPDGQLARFYELKTNKPLYFTKVEYALTYDDSNLPTHYGFKIGSALEEIESEFARVSKLSAEQLKSEREAIYAGLFAKQKRSSSLEKKAREIIAALDSRGAWVEEGTLRYHGKGDGTRQVITTTTFAKNLTVLARYLESSK